MRDASSRFSLAFESTRGELRSQISKYISFAFSHRLLIDLHDLATFADGQLTDAIRHLASDASADKKVKKKLLHVLASWRDQFKTDPSMSLVAGLYRQCNRSSRGTNHDEVVAVPPNEEKKRTEKEEAKRKARQEKEEAKEKARREVERLQAERNRNRLRQPRVPFVFEKVRALD